MAEKREHNPERGDARDPRDPGDGRSTDEGGAAEGLPTPSVGSVRVSKLLLVGGTPEDLGTVEEALRGNAGVCERIDSLDDARARIAHEAYDVLLLDADSLGDGVFELAASIHEACEPLRSVVCTSRPGVEVLLRCLRSGVSDLCELPLRIGEVGERIDCACREAERARDRQYKVERLKRICRRLSNSRQEAVEQVDELNGDLATAYQELADQMNQTTLANEFNSLIRAELDVESLLRRTLEYILKRSGPTNAAVFLPTSSCDYSLGAYINYDMPKDNAEFMLDHLADVIPSRFCEEPEVTWMSTTAETEERLGDDATWLRYAQTIAFTCADETGEPLAVGVLFRDASQPFSTALVAQLSMIRDLFAQQLRRIIRLHNRHKDHIEWSGFDVGDDDEDLESGWGKAA